jgi:hypothetical protein
MVLDYSHYFEITGPAPKDMWNDQDGAGVSIHTTGFGPADYSSTQADAQQYSFGPSGMNSSILWSCLGDALAIPAYAGYSGACREVGYWIYYEVAVTPFQQFDLRDSSKAVISPLHYGDVIGFDASVGTFDANEEGGSLSENLIGGAPYYDKWKNYLSFGLHKLGKIPGDANLDGMVDVGDLGILAANYGGSGKTWAQGDFNGDGMVDDGDLGILAANYGTGASGTDFDADYAKVFGTESETTISEDTTATDSPICSSLGLSLIAGLTLMGLMLVKLEE